MPDSFLDQLNGLFFSICNAIRKKTGSSEPINHLDIPNEIEKIPTGFNVDILLSKQVKHITTYVTEIPEYAFYKQTNLVSVEMPNATKIRNNVFENCVSLSSITIPGSVTSIGGSAFRGCRTLSNISLPEGITEIPNGCFIGDYKLLSINIPDSVTTLAYMCFSESGVKKADCKNVTTISQQAFRQATYKENLGLNTLILRADTVCTLSSTSAFTNTPISKGVGYIYVPDDLVEDYKSATNWTVYASQIRGISELEEAK